MANELTGLSLPHHWQNSSCGPGSVLTSVSPASSLTAAETDELGVRPNRLAFIPLNAVFGAAGTTGCGAGAAGTPLRFDLTGAGSYEVALLRQGTKAKKRKKSHAMTVAARST